MTELERIRQQRAQLLLLLVVIIWATNFPIAKFAISHLDVFVFNGIRFVVAFLVLAAMFFSTSVWTPVQKSDWKSILRAGFIANVLYQCAFIVGLALTTAGNAAILMATSPLWTILFHARLHKEKIQEMMWLGMGLSLAGVIMIIAGSGKKLQLGGHEIIGDLVCLAAAILWGFSTNLQKPLLVRYSSLHLATMMIGIGAVGLVLAAVPSAIMTDWSSVGWTIWVAAIVSGILSIGLANAFWSYGVQRLGPGKTSSFSNLVPVLAFVVSYVVLDEQVYLIQVFGSAITIAGVWIARR
ncbi:MAG: DMT family transporter [Bacteroidetes bacterium]|nr:DMT family transporter [Bacteroidota bacterium]MCW5896814.1 DMT family transporter [Bacteroidota bacterium]